MPCGTTKEVKKKEYAWTDHASDDIWRGGPCDSIEECVQEAKALGYTDCTIAVGLVERYMPTYVDTDRVIECLQEAAFDEVGEVAEDWLSDISKEDLKVLDERLCKVVIDWLKEYKYTPSFYKVLPLAEPVAITGGDSDGA